MRNIIIFILVCLILTGCADSVTLEAMVVSKRELVGFWHGLWHGWIAPFAFLCSLFSDDVAIYAIYNNGGWYDFGFIIGVGSPIIAIRK